MNNNRSTNSIFWLVVMGLGTAAMLFAETLPNALRFYNGLPFSLAFLCFWTFPAHRLAQITADARTTKTNASSAGLAVLYAVLITFQVVSVILALILPIAIIGATR